MTRGTNAPPLGAPVARGRTAEIYAWETGQVLKLFQDGWPADRVAREAANTRTVHAAGLPVPSVGGVVEISGRLGLVFERVEGISLLSYHVRFEPLLAP